MRKSFSSQTRFDCQTVTQVELNLNCRDEIIPVLYGLQHVYSQPQLRDEVLALLRESVVRSIEKQKAIEASDRISFEEYLENYFGA